MRKHLLRWFLTATVGALASGNAMAVAELDVVLVGDTDWNANINLHNTGTQPTAPTDCLQHGVRQV